MGPGPDVWDADDDTGDYDPRRDRSHSATKPGSPERPLPLLEVWSGRPCGACAYLGEACAFHGGGQ